MKAKINKITIEIIQSDDILTLDVDAIVNATDSNLSLPDRIARAAGPTLEQETRLIGWCDIGSAIITSAGALKFKHIIHAAGPRWGEGSERGKLANATWESLQLAEMNHLRSLAIPPISTGAFGYPVENCATTMLTQIIDFTFEDVKHLRRVVVAIELKTEYDAFVREFRRQVETLRETGEGKVHV